MTIPMMRVLNAALAYAETLPAMKRAALYQDVAKVCGDEHEARGLYKLAAEIIRTERLCQEFNFSFSQKVNSLEQKP